MSKLTHYKPFSAFSPFDNELGVVGISVKLLEKCVIWGMVLYAVVCQNDMLFKSISYQLLGMKLCISWFIGD